jgi:hypothetical protein
VKISGGGITDVPPLMKLFHTPRIGIFGTNSRKVHQLFPVNRERITETVQVPLAKQTHIQTDMTGRKIFINFSFFEKSVQMPDVVHRDRENSKRLCTWFSWSIFLMSS